MVQQRPPCGLRRIDTTSNKGFEQTTPETYLFPTHRNHPGDYFWEGPRREAWLRWRRLKIRRIRKTTHLMARKRGNPRLLPKNVLEAFRDPTCQTRNSYPRS